MRVKRAVPQHVREPPENASDTSSDGMSGPEEVSGMQRGKRAREPEYETASDSDDDSAASSLEEDSQSLNMPCYLHSFQAEEEDDEVPLGQRAAQLADGSTDRTAMRARARTTLRAGRQPRENKHRPSEASSKRPVPVLRESIQGPRAQGKDPRFESLAGGAFDERRFKSQYAFLYDEKLPEERKGLRAALKKAKGAEARADLQARLTRVEQALREENARRWKLDFKAKLKSKERAAVQAGKTPFHLKKSEQKRLELVAKFEELKASGRLEKYMEKRRKKNAAKDHRYLVAPRAQAQ
ncbi:hypothetical protein APUTEX25_005534 [Auxenochlorella protothecoides]|uniref:rRNA biogenesis protein RRP36 n=2 Tax=Auxenochlorella protothecoides TaxID=3075 RepID=A0A3M7L1D7_AUXPR|nr:hypothetical protein APUTEX25_005534 [Auxenochlorella protothecoides]|eukprot:RMZ55256.1 hypothetical protein APUTEX25_005534 [Auxenochlorella protothecoides]